MSTITELKAKFTSVWLSALLNQGSSVFSDLSLVNFVLLVLLLFGGFLFGWGFSSDVSSVTVFLYFHIFISSL